MWKVVLAFIAFSALALFVIMQGGDKIDMQGEAGHTAGGSTHTEEVAPAAPVTPPAEAPATPPAATEGAAK